MATSESEIRNKLKDLILSENPDYRDLIILARDLSKFDEKFQRFSVDAKTLVHLGRDSIKDHTTALIELVKNSYDADSKNVEVDVFCKNGKDLIRVADNGFGMTKNELLNYWLRIGFSNKRKSKQSSLGRRKTGEKGIGRISTDRLGANLELKTKTDKDGVIGIKVNWDEFDVEGKDVFDIEVELFTPESIELPLLNGFEAKSGTEIRITNLRQPWTKNNIENLYYELSSLTPPFNDVKDFEIRISNDVAPSFSKVVNSDFFKASEIELTAIYDGSGGDIIYTIVDRYTKKEKIEIIPWKNLLTKIESDNSVELSEDLRCGPVTLKLLFFLREAASVQGTSLKLSDLREFLDINQGIKIYRDNIAVKPYGFPSSQFGYDWLDLANRKAKDPAGIGRGDQSYKVTPNQLIGAIYITRDNNIELSDSAAREGLVESEAFYDLRSLVMGSINMLESYRVRIYSTTEKNREKKKPTASKEAEQIQLELYNVKEGLESIKEEISSKSASSKAVNISHPIEKSIEQVEGISEKFQKTIAELLNWNRVLSGLATMGISSAVFGHETEGSINLFKTATDNALLFLKDSPPDIENALVEIGKALTHSKRVASWGSYALTRIQREKRKKLSINIKKRIIDNIIKDLKPAFEVSSITLTSNGDSLVSKTYQMDIESILINLLTNAYTACNQRSGIRKVIVSIGREDKNGIKGYFITVADTGLGVAKEYEHRIFDPLFSTKVSANGESKSVGTGLGLTIVKSIVDELEGKVTFDQDPELKGARFKVWLPKE